MNPERVWTPSERTTQILSQDSVTPDEVKTILIECFSFAHGDAEQSLFILKKQASNAGVIWDAPDKAGLQKMIPKLEEVASTFRNPDIVAKNKHKLQKLLNKCCID